MNLNENISRVKELMGLISESDGSYDAVLVGGLDYRSSDYPIDQQVKLLKKGFGGNLKGFRYNISTSEVLDFMSQNPGIPVFLFSAGCTKAKELSESPNVDKNKLFIIEPYAVSETTKSIVRKAVSNGVPASHVFVGGSTGRGHGVVQGASDSNSSSHFGALTTVGSKVSGTGPTTPRHNNNLNENVFLRRRIPIEVLDTAFNESMSYWITNKKEEMSRRNIRKRFSNQFDNGEVTPPVFAKMIHAVISMTIDTIHPELFSGREYFTYDTYDEIFQSLTDRYFNKMEQAYNDNFGGLQ